MPMLPNSHAKLQFIVDDLRLEALRSRQSGVKANDLAIRDKFTADALCLEHWAACIQRVIDDDGVQP